MIYTKVNPKGIDIPIQRVQEYLYDKLDTIYSGYITAYGRAYLDNKNGIVKPLAYIGNSEYKELLNDDTINGLHFFFVESDESTIINRSNISENEVDIIFIVNDISTIKSTISHYADEEIKDDILKYLQNSPLFPISVVKGEKALDGFDISQIQFIHPYFAFKIKTKINNY